MTREEAIKELQSYAEHSWGDLNDVFEMAIHALRQQDATDKDVGKNEPLTLDELRKMDGEPVWVEFQDGSGGCWGLVHITMFNHVVFANGLYCTVGKPYFGKTWLTYRQKPEEDDCEH